MRASNEHILILNGGSSSIKFAVYTPGDTMERGLHGKIDRIGLANTTLTFTDSVTNQQASCPVVGDNYSSAVKFLAGWLEKQPVFSSIRAVGHRIVHGMEHSEPERITPELLDELQRISAVDPDHLPGEIELINAFRSRHPSLIQIACFDTAFHRTMPRVAQLLPIPRRFDANGIRRYGFHGISYAYLLEELGRIAGEEVAQGKIVLAHLGSGASLAAIREGRSVDTSMGFTPTAGLPMGTRPGDLDPGVAWYLMQSESLAPTQFNNLINHESGLLGVSETSSDMRDLLDRQSVDIRAAEAVALFCYQTRKWVGAFSAVLGGLETLVFSGGIGEEAPEIRTRVCHGLGYLGIELDEHRNGLNAPVISTDSSQVTVRVIPTDEEKMIAKTVGRLLNLN
ncbi:acetate/propionate family kinase [Spirosoma validum]|uniref:Acetate kinase n=1 Tax=Spirosoma validum TaxID=2771355 RepID=A0A927B7E9_9BACT|nr:acetate/propionate family kinase [Spirosoma validum]MBD2756537.1 acetate/propionate family kinase [Spirosoma validum]